jgi:hypothetical protein
MSKKIGRNELCPCGSGKKFKMNCGNTILGIAPFLVSLGFVLGLVIGYWTGWHYGNRDLKFRRQETVENLRQMMVASQIYSIAFSTNPAGVTELLRSNALVLTPTILKCGPWDNRQIKSL